MLADKEFMSMFPELQGGQTKQRFGSAAPSELCDNGKHKTVHRDMALSYLRP
jgi:hypothetical protein